jgi:hypothetical protein
VAGVNAGFTVSNIDGVQTCQAGTNSTTVVFTVANQPVGTSPQTITVGTIKGGLVTEPAGGSYARSSSYGNTSSPLKWTASSGGSLSNTDVITFTKNTAPQGTIQAVFLADSGTTGAGNIIAFANLTPALPVPNNTTVSFAANSVIFGL